MKIFIPSYDEYAIGGGWSFLANFRKALAEYITDDYSQADIYFLAGATLVDKAEVDKAQADGKNIVLRVDNVVRNSRNRGSGMTRMRRFAEQADLVIFQSCFANNLLAGYLGAKNSCVILNSADETIFNDSGRIGAGDAFLYSKYSSDETKNWEMARTCFQDIAKKNQDKKLNIVGRFDAKLEEYGFDFFNGEKVNYLGLVTDKNRLAQIYKRSDFLLYSYFNDACSNTLIEALLCGVSPVDCYGMMATGGASEIMDNFNADGAEYFYLSRMAEEYIEVFNGIV